MITVSEAFEKFRSRLELTEKEQKDASSRQIELREVMNGAFAVAEDFLTGSYKRWTKTKPLKDVDIFCVLDEEERSRYRAGQLPSVVLTAAERVLANKYGQESVVRQRRSVSVRFKVSGEEERIMSFDIVPAFTKGDHYEIPDTANPKGWTETNPKVHAEKATAANEAFGGEWKGVVRMAKRWNQENDKPVKPSFLLEVMALDLLRPPFKGDYPREFMALFASAAGRIEDTWPDPADLGPPVSDSMDQAARALARQALNSAQYIIRDAMELARSGRNGEALRKYRELFGDLFPLS